MTTPESPTMTTTESPTMTATTNVHLAAATEAYLAARVVALAAEDAYDAATCSEACAATPGAHLADCPEGIALAAQRAAHAAHDAAREAWLASDEPRAWATGGESWGGESGDNIEDVPPSEIEQHLEDGALDGDWDMDGGTVWVRDWAAPIDPATGEAIEAAQVTVTTTIEPPAPACARGRDHQWRSPYSVLGGIAENPGVWGHGGGVIIREVCAHCAAYRVTDTWAQDRSTGEQGLTEVSYEDADDASEAWVARRAVAQAEAL
jgi:hypothetical protein